MLNAENLLQSFEALEIPAPDFYHIDHVKVAYSMLNRYEFMDAVTRYASTIRTMAESVGAPEKYNLTITVAFMSVIAERMASTRYHNADEFLDSNPDLLNGDMLSRWYSSERINSPLARGQFVLPDKVAE